MVTLRGASEAGHEETDLFLPFSMFLAPAIPPRRISYLLIRSPLLYEDNASSTKTLWANPGPCMTQLFVPGTLRSVRVCLSAESLLDRIQAKDPPGWQYSDCLSP